MARANAAENNRRYRQRHAERLNAARAAARAADPEFNAKCAAYLRRRREAGHLRKVKRKPLTPAQRDSRNARARALRAENTAAYRALDIVRYNKKMAKHPDFYKTFYARKGGRKHKHLQTVGIPDSAWSQKHCDVCKTEGPRAVIDHCHATNKFRGVLCDKCNLLLGQLERAAKQPALLAYARRHGVSL